MAITVKPIFNQGVESVLTDFARIKMSSQNIKYDTVKGKTQMDEIITNMRKDWNTNDNNFAFGAYSGVKMVGFINGVVSDNVATVNNLCVINTRHGKGIGSNLLREAERAVSLSARFIEVPYFDGAKSFCIANGKTIIEDEENDFGVNPVSYHFDLPVVKCMALPVFYKSKQVCKQIAAVVNQFASDKSALNSSIVADLIKNHKPVFVWVNEKNQISSVGVKDNAVKIFVQPCYFQGKILADRLQNIK